MAFNCSNFLKAHIPFNVLLSTCSTNLHVPPYNVNKRSILVTHRAKIIKNYLGAGFVVDFAAMIPLDSLLRLHVLTWTQSSW